MSGTTASILPFADLDPARVVNAIEAAGIYVGSEPFALNSYENRVFAFRDDDGGRWVAKFYRPGRWSDAAIADEHELLSALAASHVRVGDVWRNAEGHSLFHVEGQRLALFPQVAGRSPELDDPVQLFALGQAIGQLHVATSRHALPHRPRFDAVSLCQQSRDAVLASGRLKGQLKADYATVTAKLITTIEGLALPAVNSIVVHGDCHIGNILGLGEEFALVDFDDCTTAPAVQDLWMLLGSNNEQEWRVELAELLEGYEEYREFDRGELQWIELLRTARLMRHSAWILARWDDPAFPRAFPWLENEEYWHDHIRSLDAQRMALGSPRWLA